MPRFTTVSPTCVGGGDREAWDRFRNGNYAAIGLCYEHDLTGFSIAQICELVRQIPEHACDERDVKDGLNSFPVFWELCQRGAAGYGDIIGVKNNRHSLLGLGVVTSGYRYSRFKHTTGVEGHFYPHFVDVDWFHTDEISTETLDFSNDGMWKPYGTMGRMFEDVPEYILQYLVDISEDAG